jgi:Spy/CpxP family protein refolding chaperone
MRRFISQGNRLWWALIISLAFNAGFGTTFGVRTYRHYCGRDGHGEGTSLRNLHEVLNLTPAQAALMRSAKEKLLRQVGELRQELTAERESLAGLLATADPDRVAITIQLDKIADLQRELQRCVVEHLLEEKETLTPEQQETFNAIIRRRVCPHGGHGPESVPGDCEIRGGSGPPSANGCPGEHGE